MKIHCKHDELVDPKQLKDHPKNRNKHGQDQIDRLAELYKYHGIRHPIIVSRLTGFVVAGHGRKLAAILAGIKAFPVVYQDFNDSNAEYAFIQSDNAIALWADLDLRAIQEDLPAMDDLNIDMLGIKDLTFDLVDEGFNPDVGDDETERKACPHCGGEL
jgi:ParB-like chromosome segregation protein Spo0J